MSWFVIEIVIALAPLGALLWWTARLLRQRRMAAEEEARASAADRKDA